MMASIWDAPRTFTTLPVRKTLPLENVATIDPAGRALLGVPGIRREPYTGAPINRWGRAIDPGERGRIASLQRTYLFWPEAYSRLRAASASVGMESVGVHA